MRKLAQAAPSQWDGVCQFNRNMLEEFLANSTELSKQTVKVYESNLRIWFVWVAENLANKKQLEVKPLEYKRFQNWLVSRGCSSSDVNNKRAAISSLNGYIEIYYHDEYPTFRNFINKSIKRPPKAAVHDKEPLTKAEFNHLIEVLTERKEWQKIAYLMFTLDTGCRRAESRQLLKSVVNAAPVVKRKDEREVLFYQTHPVRCKGSGSVGKVRRFTFSEATMSALKKWLEHRGADDCEHMFVTHYDGRIRQVSETLFNAWAKAVFAKIIGRRAHPHLLRCSRATQLSIEEGKDIKVLQKLLGHESPVTTQGYIVRDGSDDLDELYID